MKRGGRCLPLAVLLFAALAVAGQGRAGPSARAEALHALHDIRYAVARIDHAERLTLSGPVPFRRAAQRAIDVLVGHGDPRYHNAGREEDPVGAWGRLQRVLRMRAPGAVPWRQTLQGVKVNVMAAVSSLEDALNAGGLDEYQMSITNALTSLEVATGRSTELGTLGGLEGALATTSLGVPRGATVLAGCSPPSRAPAYGVAHGYLLYATLPAGRKVLRLPGYMTGNRFALRKQLLIVYTAAEQKARALCGKTRADDTGGASADPAHDSLPKLYTLAQARQGKKVYTAHCEQCHGKDLQGTSAPAVAGNEFLNTASKDGWTVSNLRYLVVSDMPRDAPGSLSPQQYAAVLAFLLAENCYPGGDTPFPASDQPLLDKIKLRSPAADPNEENKTGTCEPDH